MEEKRKKTKNNVFSVFDFYGWCYVCYDMDNNEIEYRWGCSVFEGENMVW